MSRDKKQAWAEDASWDSTPRRGKDKLAEGHKAVDADRQAAIEQVVAIAVEEARPGLRKIPDPVEPAGEGELTADEEVRLQECNDGVDLGNTAWFIQGKALDTIATGRLFRTTPHKLEPERCYATIEEWAEVEKGISVGQCSKLRAAWEIGEVLVARSHQTNPGQVREIVPVRNAHGLNASVAVYEMVADNAPNGKVTAELLRRMVKLLPGDLELDQGEDVDTVSKTIQGAIVGQAQPETAPAVPAIPPAVRRAVDRRAVDLANVLDRSRIPRAEVQRHLLEAFADDSDPTVYEAVLARMRQTARS
ncbi:hypothetical protein ACFCZR_24920 [Streptomyces rubiginosohelvolus]|uniref:hypothetical protein n=1 Tax=Streptomyces rubiginosohelvolus TaxID=67362 RepID=UPI0035DC3022